MNPYTKSLQVCKTQSNYRSDRNCKNKKYPRVNVSVDQVNVWINNKCRKFEVDNGSGFTLISEQELKGIYGNTKITKMEKCLVRFQDFQRKKFL